jgi:hypothetical protein
MILLLEKTLPIVFVPSAFRLVIKSGHEEINASLQGGAIDLAA